MNAKFTTSAFQGFSKNTQSGTIDYPGIEFNDKHGQLNVIFFVKKEYTEDGVNDELHYYQDTEDCLSIVAIETCEDIQDDLVAMTQRYGLTELIEDEVGAEFVKFV